MEPEHVYGEGRDSALYRCKLREMYILQDTRNHHAVLCESYKHANIRWLGGATYRRLQRVRKLIYTLVMGRIF